MPKTAEKTDPALWERVKREVTKADKGGRPGQWSARKAQLAVGAYKKQGGGYRGEKRPDNALRQWTDEQWGTKSGRRSRDTGERYLPKRARAKLSPEEYRRSTEKKRADTAKGRQFSRQPADVAAKTATARRRGQDASPGTKASKVATRGGTGAATRGGKKAGTKVATRVGSRPRLDSLSRSDLMERARARGIKGAARMRKDDLIAALRQGRG